MRILLLSAAPCVYDARPRFTARQLAALGHDVVLICRKADDQPATEDLGGARLIRVDFEDLAPLARARSLGPTAKLAVRVFDRLRRSFAGRGWPIMARSMALAEEFWAIAAHGEAAIATAMDGHIDAAHAVGLPSLPAAGRLAATNRALLVYDAVELERDRNAAYARMFRWMRLRLERNWIDAADTIATPSAEIALQLQRDYGVARPQVVHNVAPPVNPDTDASADLRRDVGLEAGTPLAVYIGAGVRDRGIGPAIRAIGRLPDVHLAIVGPDADAFRARFASVIDKAGADGRVHIVPPRHPSEITPFIRSADVAVSVVEPACASYAFALPNKLFQPVAAALPVVVGRTPTLRRTVRLTGVGESVDDRDADAFAAAIVRQAGRRGAPAYLSARARFLVEYDAASAASAWARLYGQGILKASRSRGRGLNC